MQRLAMAVLVLAACGTTDDQRPRNLDYITEAILAPSCGGATCHSSFKAAKGFVFDTIDGSRATFQHDDKLVLPTSDDPRSAGLVLNLTMDQINPDTREIAPRMPLNAPIPDADIELIQDWLSFGAPGVCNAATACLGKYRVPCVDVQTPATEKGAYKLSARMFCDGGCRDGECL